MSKQSLKANCTKQVKTKYEEYSSQEKLPEEFRHNVISKCWKLANMQKYIYFQVQGAQSQQSYPESSGNV